MLKFHFPFQTVLLKKTMNNNIVTLTVENINLSTNYYKEYLGFQLIPNSNDSTNNSNALLVFDTQKIKLEQVASFEKKIQNDVVLNFNWNDSQMKKHFNELRQKVKVKRNYSNNKNGISVFSILDCDGNILNFHAKDSNFNHYKKNIQNLDQ
jgi:catechol-2,3-dioxygenase